VNPVFAELAPYAGEPLPGPLPHDATLEPTDDTVAEVQSFVVQSRQTGPLDMAECVACLSHAIRRVIETRNPQWAVAAAAFALRLKEEHLV
jgi:hypothetical protein